MVFGLTLIMFGTMTAALTDAYIFANPIFFTSNSGLFDPASRIGKLARVSN
jgi:hypothetical protein